jgi:hypothetical protein
LPTYQPRTEATGATFTAADWLEAIEQSDPGGSDTLSNESADATVVIEIEAAKLRSAVTWILGYSWADDAGPYKLHRLPPASHPIYGTQLRATAVSFQRYNPCGNPDVLGGKPYETSPVVFDSVTRFARYTHARVQVKFAPRAYYLYSDDNAEWLAGGGKEFDRWTERYQVESSVELIDAETERHLVWVDGPGSPDGPNGKEFPGRIGERTVHTRLNMIWHEVPQNYLCDPSGVPTKILDCVGRVNSDWFPKVNGQTGTGFAPGTLLMEAPIFERHLFPWFSEDGRAYFWTVRIPLLHFDPTKPADSTVLTDRGWRTAPWRFGGGVNGGPGWYGIRRKTSSSPPTTSSPYVLEEIDFATAFDHAMKP